MYYMKSGMSLERRFQRAFNKAATEMGRQAQAVLTFIGQNDLVPVDTGALASSGAVDYGSFSASSTKASVEISFGQNEIVNPISGTPTSEYAMAQHDPHHPHPGFQPPRKPYYLSAPVALWRDDIVDQITKAYLKGLR